MKCEDFDMLMADALGGELSSNDRPAFDAHLAECERCRADFESSRRTLEDLRTLPGSRRVAARREGDRLVIEDATSIGRGAPGEIGAITHPTSAKAGPAPMRRTIARFLASPMRYAAGLLIAFTAGYALHAGLTLADASRSTGTVAHVLQDSGTSFEGSLVRAYARNPGRSDLAKCLIAMSSARR